MKIIIHMYTDGPLSLPSHWYVHLGINNADVTTSPIKAVARDNVQYI